MKMTEFFVRRPVLFWSLMVGILIAGVLSFIQMPKLEDPAVPVENSLQFAVALRKQGIPFELHIFEKGDHGLSLCDDTVTNGMLEFPDGNAVWVDLALKWLKRL